MKNIQKLINEQEDNCNPGSKIGVFLLEHSNSPEYLVAQLEAYLEAAKKDLDDENLVLSLISAFTAFR